MNPEGTCASPALSILRNGPRDFAGRTVGVLVTDGADAAVLAAIRAAVTAERANLVLIGPVVDGVRASDGTPLDVKQNIDGAPSVLYDAVVVLTTKQGAGLLARRPAARDFLTDAYAHCKFVGHTDDATPLLAATGLTAALDDGFVEIGVEVVDALHPSTQERLSPREHTS